MLEWNVYCEDWNNKSIKPWNIFKHSSFRAEVDRFMDAAKHGLNRENFEAEIKRYLMYYFWGKAEHEIILTSWPPHIDAQRELPRLVKEKEEATAKGHNRYYLDVHLPVAEKIDIYDQVMMNWKHFIDYLWNEKENNNGFQI